MALKFNCVNCNDIVITKLSIGDEYKCKNCLNVRIVPMGAETIDESELDLQQKEDLKREEQFAQTEDEKNQTLSKKYSVLKFVKPLFAFLGVTYTFGLMSLIGHLSELPGAGFNIIALCFISYSGLIFFMYCIVSMIDFLFELDKHNSEKKN